MSISMMQCFSWRNISVHFLQLSAANFPWTHSDSQKLRTWKVKVHFNTQFSLDKLRSYAVSLISRQVVSHWKYTFHVCVADGNRKNIFDSFQVWSITTVKKNLLIFCQPQDNFPSALGRLVSDTDICCTIHPHQQQHHTLRLPPEYQKMNRFHQGSEHGVSWADFSKSNHFS